MKSLIAGAVSGAVVTAAIWMIAEYVWDGIGAVMGGLLSLGLGGTPPPPPSLSYDWAGYGSVVGLAAGAAVGLVVGLTRRDARGRVVGMITAAVSWAVSALAAVYVSGSELLDGELLALAAAVLVAAVLLGALVGASVDFLFRRLGRRAEAGSAL